MTTVPYIGYAASQWLSSWLQMLGVAMVTGVAFTAVLEHHLNSVDPGMYYVGCDLTYNIMLASAIEFWQI